MSIPTLTLVVEKGPRKGEKIECKKPSDRVRIGRYVRGNNFTIKDSSISQKHLTVNYDQTSSSWVVTDLETSNGTFLNGNAIVPLVPTVLSDGEFIIFGEDTTLSVHINIPVDTNVAQEKEKAPEKEIKESRRYVTRSRASKNEKLGEKTNDVSGTEMRRGRQKKVLNTEPSAASLSPEVEKMKLSDGNSSKVDETVDCEEGSKALETEDKEIDLEKMTLAEWFDSAEKYLPMLINDAVEEIVADLKERARLFNEAIDEKIKVILDRKKGLN